MLYQSPLPTKYDPMSDRRLVDAILARKQEFGDRLVILGHHYQQGNVIQFADFTGDSLRLAQLAARQKDAEYVVFCGVHFMAESADILTEDRVKVILPDMSAGCSMADMAQLEQLEEAWSFLTTATDERIIPITYVNSLASIKAFCGRNGGACCTSSNARLILEWAMQQGRKVIFLPDQHLGRNTAYAMGFPLDSMVLYDPGRVNGALTEDQVRQARFILWKGHCSVHQLFTLQQCRDIRRDDPDRTIIVHPECSWEVVQEADQCGSTEYILKTITDAPAGTCWAVGTEVNLVNRIAERTAPEKSVRSLAGIQCLCTTMYRIDLKHLLWSLDELAAGCVVNQIRVDGQTRRDALVALERMLANTSPQPLSAK